MAHQIDAVLIDIEFLANHVEHRHDVFFAGLTHLCDVGDCRSADHGARRTGAASALGCRVRAGRAKRTRRNPVPASGVVAHRRHEDVAALFGQFHGAKALSHHGVLIAAEAMQRHDERVLLVTGDLGGHEQGVRHLLVRVGKCVGALLDAGIDCAAASASSSLRSSSGRCL